MAVIADIQGNLQALEAVLQDIPLWAPDIILVGGDITFRGGKPREVLELLSTVDHIPIRGNGDERVLRAPDTITTETSPVVKLASYTKQVLGTTWVDYLRALPDHCFLNIQRKEDVCLSHGIPGDPFKGVVYSDVREQQILGSGEVPYYYAAPEKVREILRTLPSDLFLTGHIHIQFQRFIEHVTVINPGAVCGNWAINDQTSMAEYAILQLDRKRQIWSCIFRQVPYSFRATIESLVTMADECESAHWAKDLLIRLRK
jgi:predicted phosphodiesterase